MAARSYVRSGSGPAMSPVDGNVARAIGLEEATHEGPSRDRVAVCANASGELGRIALMLAPRPECSRHVRVDDASCPFCGRAMPLERAAPPTRALPIGQLTRAAVFFGGATLLNACGPQPVAQPYGVPVQDPPPRTEQPQRPPDTPVAQPYGVPVQPEQPPPPPPSEQQIVPPSGVQLYGAPPAPPPPPTDHGRSGS